MILVAPETLVKSNRAEEEVRALRGQLEAFQRAYDISEEVVREQAAEIARIREAGRVLVEKYSRACNELAVLKRKS